MKILPVISRGLSPTVFKITGIDIFGYMRWLKDSERWTLTRNSVLIIDKIFDKALTEAHYGALYAKLCQKLSIQLPEVQPWIAADLKSNIFRRTLLKKCQEEFEQGNKWAAEEIQAREAQAI